MKTLIALASLLLVQYVWSMPADQLACDEVFASEVCSKLDEIDLKYADEISRVRRQLPPGMTPEQEIIAQLVEAKLTFLSSIGLFKAIPFLGDAINNLVMSDPQGVSKMLAGGIFGFLELGRQVLGFGK